MENNKMDSNTTSAKTKFIQVGDRRIAYPSIGKGLPQNECSKFIVHWSATCYEMVRWAQLWRDGRRAHLLRTYWKSVNQFIEEYQLKSILKYLY